tara:strand:+ start:2056 stop:2790 length:735 start_codon:yes stop_codon:yes gene_type:complete
MRWSDNDKNFGPFTYARDRYAPFGFCLDTGGPDEDEPHFRVHVAGRTLLVLLPRLFKPGRQYGLNIQEGYVHSCYGVQTFDGEIEKSACWEIPWTAWRHVRESLYDHCGNHLATRGSDPILEWLRLLEDCPGHTFLFEDFDGERLTARTYIEEREWRRGTGWFRWLSSLCKPRIQRTLEIKFSGETGRRKGSWKGGTVGHGIEMKPGELHGAAFLRYCKEHDMKFLGLADIDEEPTPSRRNRAR